MAKKISDKETFTVIASKKVHPSTMIEKSVIENIEISSTAVRFYMMLLQLIDEKGNDAKITLRELQDFAQMSRYNVKQSIANLEEQGVIKQDGKKFELVLRQRILNEQKGGKPNEL